MSTEAAVERGKAGTLWIVVALFVLRAVYLGHTDLFPEEAYYWNYAQHLDIGYLDHPPMVAWLIFLGTRLFGSTELGVRIFALLSSGVACFFTYRLAALLFDKAVARTALLLAALLPFCFLTGFIMTPDAPLAACWTGTLYFLARALLEGRTRAWLGVGVCLGLGMLSKYTLALLGPATLLFLLLDRTARRWWRHPAPYGAVLLALAIFSPVIFWNAREHWASFAFQSADRVAEAHRFSTHELLGSILLVLTPLPAWLGWRALTGVRRSSLPEAEVRGRRFARIFTLLPLAVFVFFSVIHRVKLNWTGPIWFAVLPAIAYEIEAARARGHFVQRLWIATVAVFGAAYVLYLQYLATGLPGVRYPSAVELIPVGWRELGNALDAQRAALAPPADGRVLLVGMDRNFIASEAAFYHSRPADAARETTGAHLFGSRSLMYQFWFPAKEQVGATLLLVSFDRHHLDRKKIRASATKLGPVEEHLLTRQGKPIRKYFTRVLEGYHL